tara:strand:+ start:7852 stop:9477 length:1626 start_codon:yes stop_codon:yes gene_type:complete
MFMYLRNLIQYPIFVFGLAWFSEVHAEPVFFSEASLEEAVSNAIRVDPSQLTKELMATRLHSLQLNGAKVRDLTGLRHAKSLEILTLENNLIADLSELEGLPKLRRLDLRGNRLESLSSLKNLPALSELDLSQNQLQTLAGVDQLAGLAFIGVENGGESYDSNDTVVIEGGGGSGAAATLIESEGVISAIVLTSVGTGYTSAPAIRVNSRTGSGATFQAKLSSVRKLDVSENRLRDLTGVSKLKFLHSLFAQGNQLGLSESFDDFNDNDTFDPDESFEDLNGNGKWDNDSLTELNGLVFLRDLYLYGNGLDNLSALGELPRLQTLLLGVNDISDVSALKKYPSLVQLSLNHNQITDVGDLMDLQALVYLDLSQNRLSDIRPLRFMISLNRLLLNDNNLTDLRPLSGHVNLQYLSLSSNLVSDIRPLSNLQNLRSLDASRNLIDLKSNLNARAIESFAQRKVKPRLVEQGEMAEGLPQLAEALISDKASNSKLAAYLEANGYQRLRDYHADSQLPSAVKTTNYLTWTKAIHEETLSKLPNLR